MVEAQFGVYVHIPFCVRRCGYCDFNTYAGLEPLVPRTIAAIAREIETCPCDAPEARSVYFGGGTPTFVAPEHLVRLLGAVRGRFGVVPGAEISVEANPTAAEVASLAGLRRAGFNRLSLGIQALDDSSLRRLGRTHTVAEAERAVTRARSAGFGNVSIDMMFGLPRQSTALWAQTLQRAVALGPDHISAYCLTVEPGTPYEALQRERRIRLPGERAQTVMLNHATAYLESQGYLRYEVSNYAKPGRECAHNLLYWRNLPYLGFGPGAASYAGGRRWSSVAHPETYTEAVERGSGVCADSEELSADAAAAETLVLALRMTEGCSLGEYHRRHGRHAEAPLLRARRLIGSGLLEEVEGRLRTTPRGMLTLTDVSAAILP
ncbi:MAG TPA: radical SAM family heme chaperone HemW [Chthonomonadales bacterium]|nr:radical SAM family heme chaperone HemW [Chthonomonadales bacterium]